MRSNGVRKALEQLAAETVAEKKLRLFRSPLKGFGEYDGIGLEWEDYNFVNGEKVFKTVSVKEICCIEVSVFRRDDKRIVYFLLVKPYHDAHRYFSISDTVEQAFAIKDMIDNLIDVAQATVKPNEEVSLLAGQLQAAADRISEGKATLNQVREEFGLARVESESMDQLHVWAAKV